MKKYAIITMDVEDWYHTYFPEADVDRSISLLDGLDVALDGYHRALAEVFADEFCVLPPCDNVDEIRLALSSGLVLEIPLDCEGEGRNRCPCVCVAQLGVFREPPHKYDVIEHLYTSYK